MPTDVRYADCGGVEIAYTTYGDGPIDVVIFPGLAAHLELNEEIPYFRSLIDRFAGPARLIVFDKRGSGLSDRSRLGTPEERMDDLRAVLDAVGSERAAVVAAGDAGPLAILFAASHPDRTSSLVLHGTTAVALYDDELDVEIPLEGSPHEQSVAYIAASWGTGGMLHDVFGGHPDDALTWRTLARWERNIATPRMAAELVRHFGTMDMRPVLPLIACPTLVLHNVGDPIFPIGHARRLASQIDGAVLVELPYAHHVGWGEAADIATDRIVDFVLGAEARDHGNRVLATVLFTDVVSSTERARDAGDDRWRHVLDRLERRAEEVVHVNGGRLVKTTGDGVLAVFDGPGRAVAAGRQLRDAAVAFGLGLRTGVHTGEVELRGTDVGGLAVHLAARIQSAAEAGEILVSRTVVDLTVGSSVRFERRGEVELKGFETPWELHAVV